MFYEKPSRISRVSGRMNVSTDSVFGVFVVLLLLDRGCDRLGKVGFVCFPS
jgi:hypothetical protein